MVGLREPLARKLGIIRLISMYASSRAMRDHAASRSRAIVFILLISSLSALIGPAAPVAAQNETLSLIHI